MTPLKATFLLILDGWGLAPAGAGNATSLAHTPTLDRLMRHKNFSRLLCSGREVGLPSGFMGNSEVGHLNIGAGRVVYQDMTRIDMAVEDGSLADRQALSELMHNIRSRGGRLHIMGLLSDGGVHSHIRHLFALLEAAERQGLQSCVHAFMDGRDTAPTSGIGFARALLDKLRGLKGSAMASMIGRYYAMDRDKRWDRVQQAWDALSHGVGLKVEDPVQSLELAYAAGETDEFLKPRLICPGGAAPLTVQDNDGVLFFNFRADRARELSRCFNDPEFSEFQRGALPKLAGFVCMTPYDEKLPLPFMFGHEDIAQGLGEIVSAMGIKQLRIAETEKYAHVTYFFNGGREDPFPGEERELIPSPRDVPTYDLKPGMSAEAVSATLMKKWRAARYPLVVCNFANPDMVGHTGVIPAAVEALRVVDACMRDILDFARENDCRVIVTADHGNIEEMLTPEGAPMTAHSTNPVPFIIVDDELKLPLRPEGKLADIAPTILDLWAVPKPALMTGESMLRHKTQRP